MPGEHAPEGWEIATPLGAFLDAKGTGRTSDSGSYRRNLELAVGDFLAFLDELDPPPRSFRALDDRHLREYARHLDGRDLADGTVLTYYRMASAYLGWCTREGYLDANPARTDRATEPLPADDGRRSGDQQAWSPGQRRELMDHLDDRAERALARLANVSDPAEGSVLAGVASAGADHSRSPPIEDVEAGNPDNGDLDPTRARWDAIKVFRDRALAALLGYTGVRGAEVLAHPGDDRRDGATWRDLDLSDGRLTVLAKDGTYDDRSVPTQATEPLGRYRRLLDPRPDWPVVPTMHRPTLYDRLRDRVPAVSDLDGADVEDSLGDRPTFALFREHGVTPPALSTDGGRRVLRSLTDDAGIEVDHPDHDYLTLHGARRGAGEAMVRSKGYAAAARLLDDTERMVRERYSHIEAGELADEATEAFDRVDRSG